MPTTEARRARRLVRVALIAGALGLLTTALMSSISISVANRALSELRRQHDQIDLLAALRTAILDARSDHRAYLLTADTAARANFLAADQRAVQLIDSLTTLARTDSALLPRLAGMRSVYDSSSRRRVAAGDARARSLTDALVIFNAEDSRRLRVGVDSTLVELTTAGDANLTNSRARWEAATRLERAAVYGTLVVLGVGVAMLILALRREAEQTAVSEARYRALTDESPDGLIVQSGGTVRYDNAAARAMFQLPRGATLVGRPFFALVHPDDQALAKERARALIDGMQALEPRVIRFVRDNGSVLDAELHGVRIVYDGQPAGQIIMRDMRDREEAKRALEASEQHYRALLADMDEGVILVDSGFAIQLWNPAAERILGVSGDQLAGRSALDARWHVVNELGEFVPNYEQLSAAVLRTGERVTGTFGIDRPDGTRVWVRSTAVPIRQEGRREPYAVELTFADITTEREASRRVTESEARYRMLAENSADLVSRRTLDHRYEYVSPSHEVVLGWSADEMLGRLAMEFLHPDDVIRLSERMQLISEGQPGALTVLRARHKDGHYVWLEGATKPIADEAGKCVGYQVAARDISARHALEEQLRQSQKMEAMGRMASGIAHDFNNLLTVMRASTDVLDEEALSDADRRDVQREMQQAIERASALTAQLLSFSRGRQSAPEKLRAASLLHGAIPLLSRLSGSLVKVVVAVDVDAQSALIEAEAVQVEQVLFNLVVNARDAMPQGGSVDVRCGVVALDAPIVHAHGTVASGAYVTIAVRDTGTGMSPEVLARLFEPFFTTKPQGQGTGLGLSTVIGIVQQAGGAVTVDSVLGIGTTITVYWPRVPHTLRERRLPITRAEQRRSGGHDVVADTSGKRILVVDDEPVVGAMIGRLLGRVGYTVEVENSAQAALNLLREHADAYQLLITDVRMPQLSGFDLVRRLVTAKIDVPVLFVSAQIDEPFPTDWPESLSYRFLGKPFTIEQLANEVRDLLAAHNAVR